MKQKDLENHVKRYSRVIDNGLHQIAAEAAILMAEEESKKPNQPLSKNAQKERFEKQLEGELMLFKRRMEDGAFWIVQTLHDLAEKDREMFSEEVIQDLGCLVGLSDIIENKQELFYTQMMQEKCFQEIAGVSDSSLEKMYQAAKSLYEQKNFSHSADAFGFLTILNPNRHAFWLGLANSEFYNQNYEPALFAYAFSSQVNPNDPFTHLFSCRCYEAIGEIANAVNALELALIVIKDQPQHANMKQAVENELRKLSQMLKKQAP